MQGLTPISPPVWTGNSGGTISSAGLFEATEVGENFSVVASTVTAGGETLTGLAQVTVLPAQATVFLSDLEAVFDGSLKPVSVTTDPPGLDVNVTYDGENTPPSAVGEYAVEVIVSDPNYSGIATGTLVITAAITADEAAFDAWVNGFDLVGEDAHPDADPDGDGLTNYVEWLFDFDPTDPNDSLKVNLEQTETGFVLRINRVITAGTFELLESSDLIQWQSFSALEINENADAFSVQRAPRRLGCKSKSIQFGGIPPCSASGHILLVPFLRPSNCCTQAACALTKATLP